MTPMDSLELVSGKGRHPYPDPVIALTEFLKRNARMWPLVADYLRQVQVGFDTETRNRKFDALIHSYFLDGPEYSDQCDDLRRLLDALYALPSKKIDPRALLLEYLLYDVGPYGKNLRQSTDLQRQCQCSVYRRGEDGVRSKVVESNATFDVAFLGCNAFEGHECKVKIGNRVPVNRDSTLWDEDTLDKLKFMEQTHAAVVETGRESAVYLTGLDRNLTCIQENLQRNGFTSIQLLGPDELQRLLA